MDDLEQGVRPWLKPWNAGHAEVRITRPLRANGQPYRGVNVLLWGETTARGYATPTWMTYRQAAEVGGQVRKGEHGALAVYANRLTCTETDDGGEEHECAIPFMKAYTVFNVSQVDGLPERYHAHDLPPAPAELLPRLEAAERFFAATGARVRHGGSRAFYAPGPNIIQMPPFEAFRDAESHAAVLAHEMTHWTGHPSRLDRHFPDGHRFGSDGYAFEELVAEIGAASVCAELGLTPEVRKDHAAYMAHWLKVLKSDKRAIFSAASHAQHAADFLAASVEKATA